MGSKVLVIEDNLVNVKLFSLFLRKNGFEVTVAYDAETGIGMAQTGSPDLIIMDLQLPGKLDGVQAIRVLKDDPATAPIPIVVVTAHAFQEIRDAATAAGCDAFLTKPIDGKRFIEAVREHIGSAPPAPA